MALIREPTTLMKAKQEAVVLDLGDLGARADQLRAIAAQEAKRIIADAMEQRRQLLAKSECEGFKQGVQTGIEQGVREGREIGEAKALEAASADLGRLGEAWTGGLDEFISLREGLIAEAKDGVLWLAIEIARAVVGRAYQTQPGIMAEQLERALQLVMRPSSLRVRIHGGDLAVLERALPQVQARCANAAHIELVTDDAVAPGSCYVTSAGGAVVDASLATQIERIAAALVPDSAVCTTPVQRKSQGAGEGDVRL